MNRTSGWTEERRQRQREAIQQWKPWERSTGPKTAAGKAKVACNAYRGGVRPLIRRLEGVLRDQRKLVNDRQTGVENLYGRPAQR